MISPTQTIVHIIPVPAHPLLRPLLPEASYPAQLLSTAATAITTASACSPCIQLSGAGKESGTLKVRTLFVPSSPIPVRTEYGVLGERVWVIECIKGEQSTPGRGECMSPTEDYDTSLLSSSIFLTSYLAEIDTEQLSIFVQTIVAPHLLPSHGLHERSLRFDSRSYTLVSCSYRRLLPPDGRRRRIGPAG